MPKKIRFHRLIVSVLSLVVIGSFAAMVLLAFTGCFTEEAPEAVPQEHSDGDLVPDPDNGPSGAAASVTDGAPDPFLPDEAAGAPASLAPTTAAPFRYDRDKALQYIRWYAKEPNPKTAYCSGLGFSGGRPTRIGEDCTNFASQVLWYGGMPMTYTRDPSTGWWYAFSCNDEGSSRSWRQVNGLITYLLTESRRGKVVKRASDLRIGDLIFYQLRRPEDGYACPQTETFNHTTVVSGFDGDGEPLVSYHSNDAIDVPWRDDNGKPGSLAHACRTLLVHLDG